MDWKQLDNYFAHIPAGLPSQICQGAQHPWEPLAKLAPAIVSFFQDKTDQGEIKAKKKTLHRPDGSFLEVSYHFTKPCLLQEDFIDTQAKIYLAKGVLVEAGATIKNNCIVMPDCEIRQGAYMRGNVYIGPRSVVGHTTEIKNTAFFEHVEAGHFAYIGDSLLGTAVNLGAGTKVSNLEFRSLQEKRENIFPNMHLTIGGKRVDTGLSKFGALVGDGVETGCNAVLSPLCFLGAECWVVPCLSLLKGIYPKGTFLAKVSDCKEKRL